MEILMMIYLRSKAWSGSRSSDARNIIDLLGNGFGNVGAKNGFVLDYMNDSPSIEKGFVADNDPARTAIDLNHAPETIAESSASTRNFY